jgi:hypothetical protein
MREQHLELRSELTVNLIGDGYTTSTSRQAGINTLILCGPYYDLGGNREWEKERGLVRAIARRRKVLIAEL